jgi:hypothetical protein
VASADNQTGLPIGFVLAPLHHGIVLGVVRVTGPTLPQVALRGPQKDFFAINDWCAAIHWLVLGGPWKACLRPHKIGQSPTRRFLKKTLLLVGILVLKTTTPQLVGVLVEPLQKTGYEFIMP